MRHMHVLQVRVKEGTRLTSASALASASDRSDSEREEGAREDSAAEDPPRLVTPLPTLHVHSKVVLYLIRLPESESQPPTFCLTCPCTKNVLCQMDKM